MERLKKIGKVLGYMLLLAAIVAAIVYAHIGARDHRTTQQVTSFDIHIDGGGSHMLVDVESMYRWFAEHGVSPEGKSIDEVELATLEHIAMKHSAIAEANAYMTYDGRIDMTIIQRKPIARLRIKGGYDHYISNDGTLFHATDGYAAYVPVITGDYKPVIGVDFAGNMHQYIEDSIAMLNRQITTLEHDKYQIYYDRQRTKSRNKAVQDSSLKRPKWESDEKYKSREANLKLFKEAHEREFKKKDAEYAKRIDELSTKQERLREVVSRLTAADGDFCRLTEFIQSIVNDSFWSAEVTQLVITTSDRGEIVMGLIPRSGNFYIDLGDTHNCSTKLQNVRKFYDKVLRNVGWDKYSKISVRYDGQIVCQPRWQEKE